MDFAIECPINTVSLGQVSMCILKEFYKKELRPNIFPISNVDLSSCTEDKDFDKWLNECINSAESRHNRDMPCLKLWHLTGSLSSYSKEQTLFTFYELDSPTETEIHIAKNNKNIITSSSFCKELFDDFHPSSHFVPLGFDNYHFSRVEKEYFKDDRITFNLAGKFEKRKNHKKVIEAWIKKFGNNSKYSLQCAVHNPFIKEERLRQLYVDAMCGRKFGNVMFLSFMRENKLYNDYLNSGDIVIGMSGGEGWGLPEFQSLCLGKHAVILDCSAHKDWANKENSVMIKPSGKTEVYDNIFFKKGAKFNQGSIFTFNEDEFIAGCEEAIKRVEKDKLNKEGVKLKEKFTYENTANKILKILENNA